MEQFAAQLPGLGFVPYNGLPPYLPCDQLGLREACRDERDCNHGLVLHQAVVITSYFATQEDFATFVPANVMLFQARIAFAEADGSMV